MARGGGTESCQLRMLQEAVEEEVEEEDERSLGFVHVRWLLGGGAGVCTFTVRGAAEQLN